MLDGRVKFSIPKPCRHYSHEQNKQHKTKCLNKIFSYRSYRSKFYPFQKIVINTKNPKRIIENIDIGDSTLVRAAENFKNVTIVTNKNDYGALIKELEKFKGKHLLNSETYVI